MFANDRIGDCTTVAAAHMIEGWALENKKPAPAITDDAVIAAYSAISGYVPATGANDNGAVELDVLRYWHQTGISGDRIAAYASVDPSNARLVKQAIWLFGGAYVGLALPITAQAQVDGIWDTPASGLTGDGLPGSWGGHAVCAVSYDSDRIALITWGKVQLCTWRFWGAYVDECWAVLSPDMLANGLSPQGFNVRQLQADLAAI